MRRARYAVVLVFLVGCGVEEMGPSWGSSAKGEVGAPELEPEPWSGSETWTDSKDPCSTIANLFGSGSYTIHSTTSPKANGTASFVPVCDRSKAGVKEIFYLAGRQTEWHMGIYFQGNNNTNLAPECPPSCACSGEVSIVPSTTYMEERLRLRPDPACVEVLKTHPNINASALDTVINQNPEQEILLFTRYQLMRAQVVVQYNYNVGLADLASGSYQMTPM